MLLHGLAHDDLFGIIVFESKRVLAASSLEFDLGNIREKLTHKNTSFLKKR
jgi:hypothetical protein